jgi:hypothetical protein
MIPPSPPQVEGVKRLINDRRVGAVSPRSHHRSRDISRPGPHGDTNGVGVIHGINFGQNRAQPSWLIRQLSFKLGRFVFRQTGSPALESGSPWDETVQLADWKPNFEIWFSDAWHVNTCRSGKYAPSWEPYFESAPNIKRRLMTYFSLPISPIAFRQPESDRKRL